MRFHGLLSSLLLSSTLMVSGSENGPPNRLAFSAQPTDAEVFNARIFSEPLIPLSPESNPGENRALATITTLQAG